MWTLYLGDLISSKCEIPTTKMSVQAGGSGGSAEEVSGVVWAPDQQYTAVPPPEICIVTLQHFVIFIKSFIHKR